MSRTFRRHGDAIRMTLAPPELQLLTALRGELEQALSLPDPTDPAMQRLFPPPVLGDAELEVATRAAMVDDLLERRLEGLEELLAMLERASSHRGSWRVELVDEEPLVVLGVLNDLRLAIGARIDIEALDRESVGRDDPVAYRLAVMDLLGWWQEQLIAILDPTSAAHDGFDDPDDEDRDRPDDDTTR
jgi:hypothetical protein